MRWTAAALGFSGLLWSLTAGAQQWGTPSLPPPPPPSATVQQLDAAESGQSFRRLELVYVNAEVGGAYVNLNENSSIYPGGQGGAAFGLGVGVRFVFLTLGVRGRIAPLSGFTLIQANLEAGIHVPLGAWDPYINIHGGYVDAPMNAQTALSVGQLHVGYTPGSPSGGDFGASIGNDYYFTSLFSIGIDATLDGLFLNTPATTLSGVTLGTGGSNTGVAFVGALHAGLHFSL